MEMTQLAFTKVHGLGNDFIFVDLLASESDVHEDGATEKRSWFTTLAGPERATEAGKVARLLCQRRFGVGGDGLVLLLPTSLTDHHFRFEVYNSDGSAAAMCGNALRCAAKLVWERRRHHLLLTSEELKKCVLVVDTPAGTVKAHAIIDTQHQVTAIRVNMGKPLFARSLIPCRPNSDDASIDDGNLPVLLAEYRRYPPDVYLFSSVLVGVPHTVLFVKKIDDDLLRSLGPVMERDHSIFPQGTNVSFVQVLPDNQLNYRVWERGAGPTLACGTGASAAAVLAAVLGHVDQSAPIHVHLAGGDLTLRVDFTTADAASRWSSLPPGERAALVGTVWMEGPAEIVFEGVVNVPQLPYSLPSA